MSVCKRAEEIKPFMAMEVMEKAAELEKKGRDVIMFAVGEPDFDTPAAVKEAAVRALRDGRTHYTHSLGRPSLREAIAGYYQKRFGVEVDPGRILVTTGTSPALLMLFAALLEPGDEVVMSNPHYPCYPNYVTYLHGCVNFVPTSEDDGFQMPVEGVRKALTGRTKAVLINSPSNPTGQILSAENMKQLADVGTLIISDEIYADLVYDGRKAHSILEFTDNAASLHGFSKTFAMTGWRLGWLVVPEWLVRPLQKMHQNFFISANDFVQEAGVAALTSREAWADVARMLQLYDQRRQLMVRRLKEMGLGIKVEPYGAFYVLANAGHIHRDSYELAFDILERAQVGVCPGIDFGSGAEGFLRFSYATAIDKIEEGLDRLADYFMNKCPWRKK